MAQEFCSPRVRGVPREAHRHRRPDPRLDDGRRRPAPDAAGGHLNIHADFTTHHTHENWARRVNILLYLNEEWRDEWGGKLELWDQDMTACQAKVTPAGNRMLVFTTSFDSFHGHPDGLTCPHDMARRSMALYYFTEEAGRCASRPTTRPGPTRAAAKKAADRADRTGARRLRPAQAPAGHLGRGCPQGRSAACAKSASGSDPSSGSGGVGVAVRRCLAGTWRVL